MARKNHNEAQMVKYFQDNYDGECTTLRGQAIDVVSQGRAVYNYPNNIKKFPNEVTRLADHFQGLPGPFHPEYRNYEIELQLKSWGVLPENATPSKISQMVDNSWVYWSKWIFDRAELKPD